MSLDVWRKVKEVPNIQVKFGVILKLQYNADYEEFRVMPLIKGKHDEQRTYYTDDKKDAIETMMSMVKETWND